MKYANRKVEKWTNIKPIQGSLEIYGQYIYAFINKWKRKKNHLKKKMKKSCKIVWSIQNNVVHLQRKNKQRY